MTISVPVQCESPSAIDQWLAERGFAVADNASPEEIQLVAEAVLVALGADSESADRTLCDCGYVGRWMYMLPAVTPLGRMLADIFGCAVEVLPPKGRIVLRRAEGRLSLQAPRAVSQLLHLRLPGLYQWPAELRCGTLPPLQGPGDGQRA